MKAAYAYLLPLRIFETETGVFVFFFEDKYTKAIILPVLF